MLERWSESLDLPSGFSFRGLMSTESQLLVWKGEGLPADDLSQVNGMHSTNNPSTTKAAKRLCRCCPGRLLGVVDSKVGAGAKMKQAEAINWSQKSK